MVDIHNDYWLDSIRAIMPKITETKLRELRKLRKLIGDALDAECDVVEVIGARVAVETVTAYGLTIGLDASGNAVTVESEYGFIDASM